MEQMIAYAIMAWVTWHILKGPLGWLYRLLKGSFKWLRQQGVFGFIGAKIIAPIFVGVALTLITGEPAVGGGGAIVSWFISADSS